MMTIINYDDNGSNNSYNNDNSNSNSNTLPRGVASYGEGILGGWGLNDERSKTATGPLEATGDEVVRGSIRADSSSYSSYY